MNILTSSGFAARLVLVLAIGVLSTFPATAHASSEPVVATSNSATQFSSADLFPGAAVEPLSHAEMAGTQGEGFFSWFGKKLLGAVVGAVVDAIVDAIFGDDDDNSSQPPLPSGPQPGDDPFNPPPPGHEYP